MRFVALAVLATGIIAAGGDARAQTYDPAYPVCMHIALWGGDREDCSYHTLAQCAGSASGRGGVCSPNPYYASSTVSPGRREPRRRAN